MSGNRRTSYAGHRDAECSPSFPERKQRGERVGETGRERGREWERQGERGKESGRDREREGERARGGESEGGRKKEREREREMCLNDTERKTQQVNIQYWKKNCNRKNESK